MAVVVLATAVGTAFYVHAIHTTSSTFHTDGPPNMIGHLLIADHQRASWATPLALALVIGGVAVAIGIVRTR